MYVFICVMYFSTLIVNLLLIEFNSVMASNSDTFHDLSHSEVSRYSRQLILDEFGPSSQSRLKHGSCLIVGVGGLGCPAATYLAAAGIGRLGLVDYDTVSTDNLHRQVLHSENTVGQSKVKSAQEAIARLNSRVVISCYETLLTENTALAIAEDYDVIIDATDNVATRYLLNDVSVLLHKPLVSGSALRFEGQLTVYHHAGGPCYRCIFPTPPPPETVTNCSDGGVLGVVPGVIGNLQALEAMKILTGLDVSYSGKLLLYDGLAGSFTVVKLRGRSTGCEVCGDNPDISRSLMDYAKFCGSEPNDRCLELLILKPEERISVETLQRVDKDTYLVVDCRKRVEFEICHLLNSVNIPIEELSNANEPISLINERVADSKKDIYFICHHGNDSQRAIKFIKESTLLKEHESYRKFKDIIGGIHVWSQLVDSSIPLY